MYAVWSCCSEMQDILAANLSLSVETVIGNLPSFAWYLDHFTAKIVQHVST